MRDELGLKSLAEKEKERKREGEMNEARPRWFSLHQSSRNANQVPKLGPRGSDHKALQRSISSIPLLKLHEKS